MNRDEFIEQQAALLDEEFSWTSNEEILRARFEAMALETYEHFTRAQMAVWPFPISSPDYWIKDDKTKALVPGALLQQWQEWAEEYPRLLERNPRLALKKMLGLIGESHNASSWPYGREVSIQRWIDKGERLPTPFDDRYGIVTPEFYARLREARRKAGGMFHQENDKPQVFFADDVTWQQVVAKQDTQQREYERIRADVEELMQEWKRLPDMLVAARADTAFWEALKAWELAREAKRPPEKIRPQASRPLRTYASFTGWVAVSPGDQAKSDNPPVDPIFAAFIAKYRQPDDALTVRDIVLILRGEIRTELRLDSVIDWPGSRGIGVS